MSRLTVLPSPLLPHRAPHRVPLSPALLVAAANAFLGVGEQGGDNRGQLVEHFPDACGEWQLVERFPDLKVQFVEHFPDVKIQYVQHFPGAR